VLVNVPRVIRSCEQVQQEALLLGNATGTGKGVPVAYVALSLERAERVAGCQRSAGNWPRVAILRVAGCQPRRGKNHAIGGKDNVAPVAPAHALALARAAAARRAVPRSPEATRAEGTCRVFTPLLWMEDGYVVASCKRKLRFWPVAGTSEVTL